VLIPSANRINHDFCTGILKEIVDLTTAPDLKSADIRLFCDNDKRWGNQRPTGGWYDKTK
jgi:hypothetical protein